jgi:hypothetical protein
VTQCLPPPRKRPSAPTPPGSQIPPKSASSRVMSSPAPGRNKMLIISFAALMTEVSDEPCCRFLSADEYASPTLTKHRGKRRSRACSRFQCFASPPPPRQFRLGGPLRFGLLEPFLFPATRFEWN